MSPKNDSIGYEVNVDEFFELMKKAGYNSISAMVKEGKKIDMTFSKQLMRNFLKGKRVDDSTIHRIAHVLKVDPTAIFKLRTPKFLSGQPSGKAASSELISDTIQVQEITNPDNYDFVQAMKLYRKRISRNQRIAEGDIARGICDTQQNLGSTDLKVRDYFLVAKVDGSICGFMYLCYYLTHKYALLAYLVVKKINKDVNVSRRLVKEVYELLKENKESKDCLGFIFEADSPFHALKKKEKRKRLARICCFDLLATTQGLSLRALDIDYLRPPLSLSREGGQRHMMLMYIPIEKKELLTREEVKNILEFLYITVYPDGYSDDKERNRKYSLYLRKELESELKKLTDQVQTLTYQDIEEKVWTG